VAFYQQLMADIRAAIKGDKFDLLRSRVIRVWRRTEDSLSEEPGTTNAGAPEPSL
jgi:queuine/archaeosine tRNA-ribosyltransferase